MKYLVTLIVCALLTVGLIVTLNNVTIDTPQSILGLALVALVTLPLLLLAATIWAVIGFTKTVNRWIAENNQSDDCPAVMHSRHSKDAHDLLAQHLNEAEEMRVAYRQLYVAMKDLLSRIEADVLCPRCLGLGTEEDGNTACSTCGNSGIVPLEDGTYGTYM